MPQPKQAHVFQTYKLPSGNSTELTGLGTAIDNTEVKIGEPLDSNSREGEILVRGPSVVPREAMPATKNPEWLGTGDLGFLTDGVLFVTGRQKELIIKGGTNYHPSTIEEAALTALCSISSDQRQIPLCSIPCAQRHHRQRAGCTGS